MNRDSLSTLATKTAFSDVLEGRPASDLRANGELISLRVWSAFEVIPLSEIRGIWRFTSAKHGLLRTLGE